MARRDAADALDRDERAAWLEYLEQTRGQPGHRYEEVEPQAWRKLGRRLRSIGARRAASTA